MLSANYAPAAAWWLLETLWSVCNLCVCVRVRVWSVCNLFLCVCVICVRINRCLLWPKVTWGAAATFSCVCYLCENQSLLALTYSHVRSGCIFFLCVWSVWELILVCSDLQTREERLQRLELLSAHQKLPDGIVAQPSGPYLLWECDVCGEVRGVHCAGVVAVCKPSRPNLLWECDVCGEVRGVHCVVVVVVAVYSVAVCSVWIYTGRVLLVQSLAVPHRPSLKLTRREFWWCHLGELYTNGYFPMLIYQCLFTNGYLPMVTIHTA